MDKFIDLPEEIIIIEISQYLSNKDIIVFSSCHKYFQRLFSEIYWINKIKIKRLNIPFFKDINIISTVNNKINYKRLIIELEDKILLDELDNVSNKNSDVFIYACINNYIEIVKILIKIPIIDPSSTLIKYKLLKNINLHPSTKFPLFTDMGMENINNYSLILSASLGHHEIVDLLLKCSKVDPTAIDNRTIRWTCRYGHKKVLKLLLKDGRADPGVRNNYCIRESLENHHKDITKILLKNNKIIKTKQGNIINIVWNSIYLNMANVEILIDDDYNVISYHITSINK